MTDIILPIGHHKSPSKATALGRYLRQLRVTHPELPLLKDMADTLGYDSALLSGIELGKKEIPNTDHFIAKITESYQLTDNSELVKLVNGIELGVVTECERPEIDLSEHLQKRVDSGKPLVIIEPDSATPELVEALKNMLPEDVRHRVTTINFNDQK